MTPKQQQVAVMHAVRDVRMETRPVPKPAPDEVLVRVARVGVCGSDIHYYTHGRIGGFVVNAPLVLGHECGGTVVEVGARVKRLKPGDHVAIEPGQTCRRCYFCKRGLYNLCPDVVFMATPPVDGAFCEYVAWPEDFVFPIPDSMSFEEAAMLEPLSCGIWASRRGQVGQGHSIAVFGAGPIGCVTLLACRAAGATTLFAVDLEPYRLEMAKQCGATHCLNAREVDPVDEIKRVMAAKTGLPLVAAGVDTAFETAGSTPTTRGAIAAPRSAGVCVLLGLPPDPMVEIDMVGAASREIDIRGEFRYANCYPTAIELVAAGRVNVALLATHHFPLGKTKEALEFADQNKGSSMKVVVDVA
ncbi:MAG: NAD(P)-dependent alcohol dehydrogenase [Candidatus Sumerlaeota bacterium]|nr:NAD(P)-dependent alcohol dehydrogenase [Candidatus Sumerlaeota bacterium]